MSAGLSSQPPVKRVIPACLTNPEYPYTFRIIGSVHNSRRLVQAATAFDAYRLCDPKVRTDQESFLGAFWFGEDFAEHLRKTGSTKHFSGNTWAPLIWWDIDREPADGGLAKAIADTQRLVETLEERYSVPPEYLLCFISGGKGCHLGLPTALWQPAGGTLFHRAAREFALQIAAAAGVVIDAGIYDSVRAFRAANSRHPKTGLHKRFVPAQSLGLLTVDDARIVAASPAPFEWPDLDGEGLVESLGAAWLLAEEEAAARQAAFGERRQLLAKGALTVRVNRLTLDLIRGETVAIGDRHRVIYSAARNLAEAGASPQLVSDLLREAALDTGLPPREVDRQIDCGCMDAVGADTSSHENRVQANSQGQQIACRVNAEVK